MLCLNFHKFFVSYSLTAFNVPCFQSVKILQKYCEIILGMLIILMPDRGGGEAWVVGSPGSHSQRWTEAETEFTNVFMQNLKDFRNFWSSIF